jgi:hypothetical protein
MSEAISTGVAQARLEVSYGMTAYGARCVLDDARMNGNAETVAVRVTLKDSYPETFTVVANA